MSLRLKSLILVGLLGLLGLMLPNPARADDFTFTFTDGTNTVNGLVTGLTDNGVPSIPTSVTITSVTPIAEQDAFVTLIPALLTYNFVDGATTDSFTETDGVVTNAAFESNLISAPPIDGYLEMCFLSVTAEPCFPYNALGLYEAELGVPQINFDIVYISTAAFQFTPVSSPEPSFLSFMLFGLVALVTLTAVSTRELVSHSV